MKSLILIFIVAFGFSASANEIRHQVKRSSDLERELAYKLSVLD